MAVSEPTVPLALGRLRVIHPALRYSQLQLLSVASEPPLPAASGAGPASRQGACDERRKERGGGLDG